MLYSILFLIIFMIFPTFSMGYLKYRPREDSGSAFSDDSAEYSSLDDSSLHSKHEFKKEVNGKAAD